MQRKTKKTLDIVQILINLIMLGFMITSLITNKDYFYNLYWTVVPLMLGFEVLYLLKWNKIGEWNVDKKDSKAIRYSFDGITGGALIITVFIYLSVILFESFQKSIKTNTYIIIIVYVLFTISILCNYLAIYSANRDTKKLAEKTFKYKK